MSSSRKLLYVLALTLLLLTVDSAPWGRRRSKSSSSSSRSSRRSSSRRSSSSSSSRSRTDLRAPDLRGSDLSRRLASPVYKAEKVSRTIGSLASSAASSSSSSRVVVGGIGGIARFISPQHDITRHSGVRVTLEDGSKWLVHKGEEYGHSSQTVVTDARHMSSAWQADGPERNFQGSQTVSDLIRTGGDTYHALKDNCHHAADRIMSSP